MANANYLRGRRFEWRVRDTLRREGWTVLRTAGSKGPVDLIALRAKFPVWLIQCKTRAPTAEERTKALQFAKETVKKAAIVWLVWPEGRTLEWEDVCE